MESLFNTVKQILHGIEDYHDSYTLNHEKSVGKMMGILSHAYGLDKKTCLDIEQAGELHDIGKLGMPSQILDKPGSLTAFERDVIKMHPLIGKKMLENIEHPLINLAKEINTSHHEAFDGSGYPYGQKKNNIPLAARICSICDVYDAIRAHRPYHSCIAEHKTAVKKILNKGSDGLFYKFDPELLEVFAEIHEKFDLIFCNTYLSSGLSNVKKP